MKLRFMALMVLSAIVFYPQCLPAQNTIVTYQGNVQAGGTNFTGTGLFQFALVTSTNANLTATATADPPASHFITTINVAFGGSGYVIAPAVTIFGGGGSNATATASISNGVVIAITINPGGNGSGYTNTPSVIVAPPPPALTYTTYWSNDGTSVAGSEPSANVSVGVTNGLFIVGLGDTTILGMSAINAALFSQPNLQLQIWFNDGINGFAALSPVQNLTTVPYAAFADYSSNLLGNISAAQISGTVASSTLPTNAVFSGPVSAASFSGNGTNLTSLNASSLVAGMVPLNCLSGITSNQLDAATWQMATNLNGGRAALASNVVSGIAITNAFITNSVFAGNGGGLTNLPASQLVSIGNTVNPGNFFVGAAGNSTMTGYNNTGIGVHALAANVGGLYNTAEGLNSLLANTNGTGNTAIGTYALQANINGSDNTAIGLNALYTNTNGNNNTASGMDALYSNTNGNNTAVGANALQTSTSGFDNTAVGYNALFSSSTGSNNIALGYLAGQAVTTGSSNIDIGNAGFSSDANVIRIGTSQTSTFLVGNVFTPSGTVQSSCDRNLKENFTPINPREVLNKVSAMPLTEWQYKMDADNVKHIGPMAQDFHAAFGLNGADDKHISVVDEGGVALAAIQGLNQKLAEKDVEIQDLQARLEKLERLMDDKTKETK